MLIQARAFNRSIASCTSLLALLCVAILAVTRSAEASEPSLAAQVKAACIVNFIRFVDWPEDAFKTESAPIVIGVVGEDPYHDALDVSVSGKEIHGRKLQLKRINAEQAKEVHVLIVGDMDRKESAAVLQKLQQTPILTIGEGGEFMRAGGLVRFYEAEGKVRFEINAEAAKNAKLRVSSKLLKLATIYAPESPIRKP